jgi:hypothetical protein
MFHQKSQLVHTNNTCHGTDLNLRGGFILFIDEIIGNIPFNGRVKTMQNIVKD